MNPQSTPATRTRLVWHTAEIKRTAAALAALGIIGVAGAAMCWAGVWGLYIIGTVLTGG